MVGREMNSAEKFVETAAKQHPEQLADAEAQKLSPAARKRIKCRLQDPK
jgi:hypothetical protein